MDKQRADGIFSGSIRWAARSPAPDTTPPLPTAPVPSLHRLARLRGSAAPLALAALLLVAAVSTAAPASAQTTQIPVPGTILNLSVKGGVRQVMLSWTVPDTGKETIIGFLYKQKTGTGSYDSSWMHAGLREGGGSYRVPVGRLANNTTYIFKMRALFSDFTSGPVSNEVRVMTWARPGTISLQEPTLGDRQVTLTWSLPNNGGAAITKFQYRRKVGAAAYGGWANIPNSGPTTTGHTVPELANGTIHCFQVRAVNNVGIGPASNEKCGTPAVVAMPEEPGTISDLTGTLGDRQVTLAWGLPNNGGAAITKFQYQRTDGAAAYGGWANIPNSGPTTTGHTVPGLANGTTYCFQVRAVNRAGPGRDSNQACVTPAAVPGTISDLTATQGDGQVTLTWSLPGDNGGAAITKFQYQRTDGAAAYGGWVDIPYSDPTTTDYKVPGLANDTTYSFKVRAVNRAGPGRASDPMIATLAASPGQPPTGQPGDPAANAPANAAPAFSSAASVRVAENQRAVLTVQAVDADEADGAVRYRLSGGVDQARFALDPATGALSFVAGPDYEHPLDAGGNNDYVVTVQATSGTGERERSAEQTIAVTVTDVAEAVIGPRATSAWLARVGRTVTDQVLDAVAGRLAAPRAPGGEVRLAGQALPAWSWEPEEPGTEEPAVGEPRGAGAALRPRRAGAARAAPGRTAPGRGVGPETRARTGRDLVAGTAFTLTGAPRAHGLVPSVWGRGALTRFDGRDGPLTLDGEAATGLLGADWAGQHWTAGVALGHSRVTGGYRASAATGTIEAALTGVYPYVGWDLTERLTGWAAAGYGGGEFTLTPPGGGTIETDLTLAMGAAGLRGAVLQPSAAGGLALAVKSDVRVTRTSAPAAMAAAAGRLRATTADVWRLRAGVEGTRPVTLNDAGATLTPSFEVGARLDGGDAETGVGADVGGGLALADPTRGLHLALNARALLVHEAQGFREWGASAAVGWDPQPATEQGLALALTQAWGGAPAGGMDALLARDTLAGLAGAAPARVGAGRLTAELGYGLAVLDGAFTGISTAGLTLTPTGCDYRLGWRLTPTRPAAPGVVVHLDATRSETRGTAPAHAVMLRGDLRF